MATPNAPTTSVSLGGRTLDLLFDLNALCDAEDVVGKSLVDAANWRAMTFRDIRALLWAGQKSVADRNNAKPLTLEEIGQLLNLNNLEEASDAILKAFQEAMPKPQLDVSAHGSPLAVTPAASS